MPSIFKSLQDKQLVAELLSGKVGVIPTDTVYGLVCLARDQPAVARLYGLKAREAKPGTFIAANIDQLAALGIKRSYLKAVEQFWPGAITVIVPFTEQAGDYLRLGKYDIAVRLPNDTQLNQLLAKTGALLTTSANLAGTTTAATIKQAQQYFGDKVDFYVDGGDLSDR